MKRFFLIALAYLASVPVVGFVLMAKGASPAAVERAQREGSSDASLIVWTLVGSAVLCALIVLAAYALKEASRSERVRNS